MWMAVNNRKPYENYEEVVNEYLGNDDKVENTILTPEEINATCCSDFDAPSVSWIKIKRGKKRCMIRGVNLIDCRNKIKQKYPDWVELSNSEDFYCVV